MTAMRPHAPNEQRCEAVKPDGRRCMNWISKKAPASKLCDSHLYARQTLDQCRKRRPDAR